MTEGAGGTWGEPGRGLGVTRGPGEHGGSAAAGQTLLGNAAALVASQVATKGLNIAVSLLMVRWLGPDDLGRYAYILAFCYPFGALTDIGLGSLAIREISKDPTREAAVLGSMARLVLGLTALSGTAMLTLAALTRHEGPVLLGIALQGLSSLFCALTSPYLVLLTARERMGRVAVYQVSGSALGGAATLGTLLAGGRVIALLLAGAATNLVLLGLARLLAGPRGRAPRPPRQAHWAMLRQATPFGLVLVGFTVYYRIDMVMLRWLRSVAEVGRYAAAYRFQDAVLVLAHAVGGPFYPRLSRLMGRDRQAARGLLQASATLMFGWGLPLAMGTFLLAEPLVLTLFGPEFHQAGSILRILIWASIPVALIVIPNHALNAADRVWSLAGIYACGVAVNTCLNLMLIPRWGAEGAALATLVCEWLSLLLVGRVVRSEFGLGLAWPGTWRYLLAVAAMAGGLRLVRGAGLPLEILAGAAVYAAALVALGYLGSGDFQAVRRALAR